MNPFIREATKDDAILLADISQQTFYETFAKDNTKEDMDKFLNEQFTRGKLILEVGSPGNFFLIAYLDVAVAGYAKLRETKSHPSFENAKSLEIARLYALTPMIGKGIGSALMKASLDFAMKKNKELIWLSVWEKNQRAIDFYLRWGFEKFDETDFLLGDDVQRDWMMKRNIVK